MKKQLILLSFVSSMLLADTFTNPLPASVKATDNGGVKQAIDAYKDGIGAELVEKPGVAVDNSAMNILTIKYGEAAKVNNVTVVNQVVYGNSNPTSADLALAGRLTVDGAACNDSNINTTGETWLNGVCQGGTMVNGIACNDGNAQTTNDTYNNGVCLGTNLYDNCEGGLLTYTNAANYCASKGMRIPTKAESIAGGGNIPSCNTGATYVSLTSNWTSTLYNASNYYVWIDSNIGPCGVTGTRYVRCVK
jgi:hypothetical protein